jgi:uncharacterized protein YbjT (DUF2867 family)
MTKRILILGGTGMFGKPTAIQLKADGFQARILARDVAKAQNIFTDGYQIMPGDVTDPDSLEKAITGCDGVHISVGGPVDQMSAENVAALAPKLGVEHITYISGATVAEANRWFPMVAQKLEADPIQKRAISVLFRRGQYHENKEIPFSSIINWHRTGTRPARGC